MIIKKLTYILLIIFAATSFNLMTLNVSAAEPAADPCANTPGEIIPAKPKYLPGPCHEELSEQGLAQTLISSVLPKLAVYLIGIVGGTSILFLVIAGVRFSTAYGNDETIQKAKNQAIWAVVATVLALLAYTIVQITFNIDFS